MDKEVKKEITEIKKKLDCLSRFSIPVCENDTYAGFQEVGNLLIDLGGANLKIYKGQGRHAKSLLFRLFDEEKREIALGVLTPPIPRV